MALNDAFTGSSILVVDDEEANVTLLERMLARAGYRSVTTTTDSRRVTELVEQTAPDLVLLDLMMPHVDGYEILAQLNERLPADDYLPVLVLTADVSPQALQRALSSGARDFLTKPFNQTELLLRVRNLLETRHLYTNLRRQLDVLDRLNADATRSIAFRDESLSAISHDIGQPLAALRLTADLMQQAVGGSGDQQLADDVRLVVAATAQLTAMITELSDLARLQMGRELVLQRRPMDLVAVVREQAAAAQKGAGRRRIRVTSASKELTGAWDRVRLTRVVSNLLSNAVRYTPPGGQIQVEVEALANASLARLKVADQGVGIPAADLPHVFERYYRAGNVKGKVEGTGLGLPSARQIVEQHGGSIDVQSVEGAGTTVTVTLPLT